MCLFYQIRNNKQLFIRFIKKVLTPKFSCEKNAIYQKDCLTLQLESEIYYSKMKLIIMTKATFFVEEDKILTTLFEEGMENLHLYKPGSEPIYAERLLTLLPDDYYKRITVHDHFYLKEEYGLRGIHLNNASDSLPIGYRSRTAFGLSDGNVSRTCHSIDELAEAKKKSKYVFLKTIFDSQSNPNDKQSISYNELEKAAKQGLIDKKVYAMGGINLDNIRICHELGFGGVVVCGDLWNRFNIHNEQDYKALIMHFQKLQKAVG